MIWSDPTDWDWCVTHADGEDGEVSKLAEVPAAKRKTVKRPQPKLDSLRYDTWGRSFILWRNLSQFLDLTPFVGVLLRLISDRGLPALRTLFDDVRFKGKGHEVKAADVLNSARRVSQFILMPCVSCWSRRRTCECSCRRWRTGPTGFTPNCSLKNSLTKWSDSARRRKSRWEVWMPSLVVFFSHSAYVLVVSCRPVWKGSDWTCRSRMKITQVLNQV